MPLLPSPEVNSRIWIVGGGGAALQVWALLRDLQNQGNQGPTVAGFVVADPLAFASEGLPVRAEQEFLAAADPADHCVTIAVGDPRRREQIARRFAAAGFVFPTLIHPTAIVGAEVTLGEGCIVMAHSILETHLQLGSHVMVNLAAVIAHEGCIGSFTNIGPRSCLAGAVSLGNRCDLGAGVTIRPRIRLGDDLVVGAGSVVVKNRLDPGTLVGNPARLLLLRSRK